MPFLLTRTAGLMQRSVVLSALLGVFVWGTSPMASAELTTMQFDMFKTTYETVAMTMAKAQKCKLDTTAYATALNQNALSYGATENEMALLNRYLTRELSFWSVKYQNYKCDKTVREVVQNHMDRATNTIKGDTEQRVAKGNTIPLNTAEYR